MRTSLLGLVAIATLLAAGDGAAQTRQWRNIAHTPASTGLPAKAAMVVNEQGYGIRVYMADASRVVADFSLPPGLRALDSAGCPTFKVDAFEPDRLHLPPGRCLAEGARARLEIARVVDGAVESEVMLQLLNGEDLHVIHRLKGAGYASVQFTLKGSKSALLAALPPGTVIVGD